jgi:hypothetical protein
MKKLKLNRIDKEVIEDIGIINSSGRYRTVASCSGHGKYRTTIILKDRLGDYYEYYSGLQIHPVKRRYLCFYMRDKSGIYFIPEVENYFKCHETEVLGSDRNG